MKWILGKVISQKKWAEALFSLYVEASIEPFVAGQFIQISPNEQGNLFRPYSFVNGPEEPLLEFYYTHLKKGFLSDWLANCRPNDKIWLAKKGSGRFVLAQVPPAKILWLFATGTGLGPFLSILKTKEPWLRFEKIILVHSVSVKEALTHQTVIANWQTEYYDQFYWMPVVTQQEIPNTLSLRIPVLLEKGILEKLANVALNTQTSQVMLCGNPSMIEDVCKFLETRQLYINRPHHSGHITVENYWKRDIHI